MVAEVIIDSSISKLNRIFDYEIPANLNIKVGSRVFVPFGNKKELEEGIVVNIKQNSEYKIKEIAGLQEEQIGDEYIELAKWMGHRYFCNVADCLKLMLPPGRTSKNLNSRIKEKKVNTISLAKSKDEIKEIIESNSIKSEKQKRVLNFMLDNDNTTLQDINLFTDATSSVVNALVKKGLILKNEVSIDRNPLANENIERTSKLKLTDEQNYAIGQIKDSGEYLLYGVTGSGKTEIYLQLIEKNLLLGKSSIMLVPEISLTPQTVNRFIARFGSEKIAVLHSKLSTGERFDEWNRIKNGKAKIIIGARSAIFAPAQDLGIIIIDEEHDESYSSEMSPRYNTIEVAEYLSRKMEIPLVLGSATPDMRSFYKAKCGKIKLLTLSKRANNSQLPDVKIVDMRLELANGNKSMISESLSEAIKKNIENKHQTILFLNRRGFSTFIMCRDCGYTVKCKRCNIALTYHKEDNKLKCHYCGYEQKIVTECPECHSKNIKYFGAGTQKLEDEIKKCFPEATTIRMDIDSVSKKNSHEEIIEKFKNENIDILIGTQMVVKGHHFPNVTLVGVITADSNLNMGDFRASEKTFQTLTQVAGRAGRGSEKGNVIIQTYNPDNYAIEYAKTQNFDLFYNTEIGIRKELKYPPFCDIIVINMSSKNKIELQREIKKVHAFLKEKIINEKFGVLLYSPVTCPIDKIKDRYRMRILIKCLYDEKMNKLMNETNDYFYKQKANNCRLNIELNPNNML